MSFLLAITAWKPFPWRSGPSGIIATMTCPGCGKDLSISGKIHTIATDGAVSPSMVCPHQPCTFHAFIRLEGWTPPAPPAPPSDADSAPP